MLCTSVHKCTCFELCIYKYHACASAHVSLCLYVCGCAKVCVNVRLCLDVPASSSVYRRLAHAMALRPKSGGSSGRSAPDEKLARYAAHNLSVARSMYPSKAMVTSMTKMRVNSPRQAPHTPDPGCPGQPDGVVLYRFRRKVGEGSAKPIQIDMSSADPGASRPPIDRGVCDL